MESAYLETTFVSYLVARPSRDARVAVHQQVTQEWWTRRRNDFECFVSQIVIDEASLGDPTEVIKRLAIIGQISKLEITRDAELLAMSIVSKGVLPPSALRDAGHVAVAAAHGIDYLLTWNCKHLANAQNSRKIGMVCTERGFRMPTICTPEELMGGS